jgi:predicted nucleic acid-binding protein
LQRSAISVAVADAGPLIALARLDRLALLAGLFDQVLVPEAVFAKCMARPELADATRIRQAYDSGRLTICVATSLAAADLGRGEHSAIGKAIELKAALVADDVAARRRAEALGLVTIGTLGVLGRAKHKGLLPQLRPEVDQLRASGNWLGDDLLRAALRAAGESDA